LEPRPCLAPDADGGGVPLLSDPPDHHHPGRARLAGRGMAAGVRCADPDNRDGGGMLALLSGRPPGALAAPPDRVAAGGWQQAGDLIGGAGLSLSFLEYTHVRILVAGHPWRRGPDYARRPDH